MINPTKVSVQGRWTVVEFDGAELDKPLLRNLKSLNPREQISHEVTDYVIHNMNGVRIPDEGCGEWMQGWTIYNTPGLEGSFVPLERRCIAGVIDKEENLVCYSNKLPEKGEGIWKIYMRSGVYSNPENAEYRFEESGETSVFSIPGLPAVKVKREEPSPEIKRHRKLMDRCGIAADIVANAILLRKPIYELADIFFREMEERKKEGGPSRKFWTMEEETFEGYTPFISELPYSWGEKQVFIRHTDNEPSDESVTKCWDFAVLLDENPSISQASAKTMAALSLIKPLRRARIRDPSYLYIQDKMKEILHAAQEDIEGVTFDALTLSGRLAGHSFE